MFPDGWLARTKSALLKLLKLKHPERLRDRGIGSVLAGKSTQYPCDRRLEGGLVSVPFSSELACIDVASERAPSICAKL